MSAKSTTKKPATKPKSAATSAAKAATKPKAATKTAPKTKSTAKSQATAKPKAAAKTAPKPSSKATSKTSAKPAPKPSPKPKAVAKTAPHAAKAAAKSKATAAPTPATKADKKPARSTKSAAKAALPQVDPLEVVRPLIKVRQAREFTTKKLTPAELDAITEVARWSGSSRNEQPCRFIAIRNRDLIRQVAELGLPQTRGLPTAAALIAIIVPEEPERELWRAFDDGRAAERILVAAHLLGLGGGISRVRPDVRPGINKALKLPANRSVRTIVGLGHPTEDALQSKSRPGQARLPREEVIYKECWPESPKKD